MLSHMLSPEEKKRIDFKNIANVNIASEVLKMTEKNDECTKKQWTYTRKKGKKIVIIGVLEKIMH
jgi:hypothetical protein